MSEVMEVLVCPDCGEGYGLNIRCENRMCSGKSLDGYGMPRTDWKFVEVVPVLGQGGTVYTQHFDPVKVGSHEDHLNRAKLLSELAFWRGNYPEVFVELCSARAKGSEEG